MMEFLTDPKWSPEETRLHKERFELHKKMMNMDSSHREYQVLARRYHEICDILDDY